MLKGLILMFFEANFELILFLKSTISTTTFHSIQEQCIQRIAKKNTNCKKVHCITFMRSKASNIEVFSDFLQYQTKCLNIFRLETMTEKQTNVT